MLESFLKIKVHYLSRVAEGTGPMKPGNRGKQRCQFRQGNLKDERHISMIGLPLTRETFLLVLSFLLRY